MTFPEELGEDFQEQLAKFGFFHCPDAKVLLPRKPFWTHPACIPLSSTVSPHPYMHDPRHRSVPTLSASYPPPREQHRDRCVCFSCKRALHSWEKGDSPLYEHCRWSPTCAFIQSVTADNLEAPPFPAALRVQPGGARARWWNQAASPPGFSQEERQ